MNLDEARRRCRRMSELNMDIWAAADADDEVLRIRGLRNFGRELSAVESAGFSVKKKYSGGKPVFSPVRSRSHKVWSFWDPRPEGLGFSEDCTTRTIQFCTGQAYERVLADQKTQAEADGVKDGWNVDSVWAKLLFKRGWKFLKLPVKIRRDKVARLMAGSTEAVVTHSKGHVAPVKDGVTYDRNSSSWCMVDWVLVHSADLALAESALVGA